MEGKCSSYVIYVDVKQHYFDMIVSISEFLEKHEADIDAFNFATMDLMLPITGPIGLAYKSVQLSIKGVKPIVALESLAKLSGKTLTEVMEAIKAGMPLLGKMAETLSKVNVDIRKFSEYIFKTGGCDGKEVVYNNLGYFLDDSELLTQIYKEQAALKYSKGEYTLGKLDEYGQRIDIEI